MSTQQDDTPSAPQGHGHSHAHGGHGHSHGGHGHSHGGHGHSHGVRHVHGAGMGYGHDFADAELWVTRFECAARDEEQQPDVVVQNVLATAAVPQTGIVVDLGAGTGYFATRFARALPQGRVLAVDIEATLVEYMRKRAVDNNIPNMQAIKWVEDALPSFTEPVDVVFICTVYHHMNDREAYFRELLKFLKPNGMVVIMEGHTLHTNPETGELMTQMHFEPIEVVAEMTDAGYQLHHHDETLQYHYILFFKSQDAE